MGTLYIVSTPIGNLKDITLRALDVLKSVDYVLCEDTRVSGKLLNNYQVVKKMVSFNDFSEETKTPDVIADLVAGSDVALVCDAGTPLISDPGYKLVREAIKNNIDVQAIPGPSAVVSALTISGLPPDKFIFIGYPPKKEGKKKELFENLKANNEKIKTTVILYESPFRVVKTLNTIKEIFGNIDVCMVRELTKLHEEVKRRKVEDLIRYFEEKPPKGEIVLLF